MHTYVVCYATNLLITDMDTLRTIRPSTSPTRPFVRYQIVQFLKAPNTQTTRIQTTWCGVWSGRDPFRMPCENYVLIYPHVWENVFLKVADFGYFLLFVVPREIISQKNPFFSISHNSCYPRSEKSQTIPNTTEHPVRICFKTIHWKKCIWSFWFDFIPKYVCFYEVSQPDATDATVPPPM